MGLKEGVKEEEEEEEDEEDEEDEEEDEEEEEEDEEDKEEDEEEEVVSSERIYLSYLVGSIFPQEVENIEDSLDEVISIAKSENLQQLLTAANFLKISISGKDKGEVTLELKKFAPQIKEIMKQELGLEK